MNLFLSGASNIVTATNIVKYTVKTDNLLSLTPQENTGVEDFTLDSEWSWEWLLLFL